MILSVCATLITIDDNSCYFIVNIFSFRRSSKLLLYCWCAALNVCCAEWHICVLWRVIVYIMGGQLVFDSDRFENFLIIRDRPVGNKVANTICQT